MGLWHKGWLVIGGGLGVSVMLTIFSRTGWLPGALALLFVVGMLTTVFTATIQTLMQQLTSDQMRGRVMSLFAISVIGMWPLGTLPLSWAADRFGVAQATTGGALIAGLYALVVAAAFYGTVGGLRLADESPDEDSADSKPESSRNRREG